VAGGERQQGAEHAGDEQVAVAHHCRAEQLTLQPRQAGGRVRRVERVVGTLQQVGDHERRVDERHREDSGGEPARRRDGGEQHTERDTAERGERKRRGLSCQRAGVRPGKREQRQHEQRPRGARPAGQPAERGKSQQRHGAEREIGQPLGACLFGEHADEHEAEHRQRRDHGPAAVAQPRERRHVGHAGKRDDPALRRGEQADREPEREHRRPR